MSLFSEHLQTYIYNIFTFQKDFQRYSPVSIHNRAILYDLYHHILDINSTIDLCSKYLRWIDKKLDRIPFFYLFLSNEFLCRHRCMHYRQQSPIKMIFIISIQKFSLTKFVFFLLFNSSTNKRRDWTTLRNIQIF